MTIFAIYDKKAEYFLQPMFSRNVSQMIRDLDQVVSDEKSVLHRFPADFALYQLGDFDESSGVIANVDKLKIGDIDSLYKGCGHFVQD